MKRYDRAFDLASDVINENFTARKKKNSALMTNLPIKLFEMGSNQWRYYDNFTSGKQQIHYFHSNGLAAINNQAGKLVMTLPETEIPVTDDFVHDPWRPVPSLGGHASFP